MTIGSLMLARAAASAVAVKFDESIVRAGVSYRFGL
jgi:hypothetical protein